MLKKLRRKFIAIAMLSVSIVLIAIVGTINIANYMSTNEALDARLKLIAGNGGTFPDLLERGSMGEEGNTTDESINKETPTPKEPPSGRTDVQPPEDMNQADLKDDNFKDNDLKRHGISLESQFDTRYFTVTINSKGEVENIDTSKIASVSSENAAEYAKKLWKSGKKSDGKSGFADNCKYLTVDEDGSTMYIFLSCQRELSTIKTYILASVGISVFGLLVVFVMIYFFSGKILKPVSESYEKQKRFITDASHEIKTPLTIIDANTEVIEMMEGENEWTSSTRKQVARLTSLTEKLVFLSRMDEEATKLEMLEFSLSDAILDTAEPFKAVAQTKGKKLTIDVTDKILYTGDEKTIRQLVSILLDNAIKYSGCSSVSCEKATQTQNNCVTAGDPAPEIELTMRPSGKNRIITVWNTVDDTANIKKGRQDMLFERFYRTDASRNSKTGGFGIGLSAAYAIVKAHKGKITAESKDGQSIKFTIVL
nr:HAMP domain-containing sensor histidine kinase [uncultured Agathobacter sp.]